MIIIEIFLNKIIFSQIQISSIILKWLNGDASQLYMWKYKDKISQQIEKI